MGKRTDPAVTSAAETALAANPAPKAKRPFAVTSAKSQTALANIAKQVAAQFGFKYIDTRPGQNLKATAETIADIVGYIGDGLTIEEATILAGVAPGSMARWKASNEHLAAVFQQAEMEDKRKMLAVMRKHAAKDVRAASFLLERRYGMVPVSKSEVTGKDGGPMLSLTIHKQLVSGMASGPSARAEVIDVPVDAAKP